MTAMAMEVRLFGGAISCRLGNSGNTNTSTTSPTTTSSNEWRDISEVRQVPDHQECWQDSEQRVLVVEILEHQHDVQNEEAASYFFSDLAESNGSIETKFVESSLSSECTPSGLPSTATVCRGIGRQRVKMGRDEDLAGNPRLDQEIRSIRVELAVIRLPSVTTDLLVTLSTPDNLSIEDGFSPIFHQVISSFQIHDWSLFG